MGKLMKYVRPQVPFMILTLIIKFFGTYIELWIPTIMETMLDDIVPTGRLDQIYLYGGIMLLCAATCMVLTIIANRMPVMFSWETSTTSSSTLCCLVYTGRLFLDTRMITIEIMGSRKISTSAST